MRNFEEIENDPKLRSLKIFRIFSVERLFQIMNEKQLVLLSPEKWEDPYEKPLQKILELRNRDKIFGLCWSLNSHSDALWRIYSPTSQGVKITTTLGDLVDSFLVKNADFNKKNLFIGAVTYLPETSHRKTPNAYLGKHALSLNREHFTSDIFNMSDAIKDLLDDKNQAVWRTSSEIAKSFYMKRKAFEHEKEIRLIYVDGQNNSLDAGLYKIAFDPMRLIKSIQFDPRMDDDIFTSLKNGIIAKTGEHKISITKSRLYTVPKNILKLIPK